MMRINKFHYLFVLVSIVLIITGTSAPVEAGLTIEEAYELALENSDRIKISKENVQQSRAGQTIASSGLWPQLELRGSKIRQKEIEGTPEATPKNDYTYGVELNQYLFQGGKRFYESSAARWQLQATQAEDYRQRQQVLFNVAKNYYSVLLARRNKEIARSVRQRAQNQLERAEGRFEVGEITRTGVLRAEVQVARAREQLQRAKNSQKIARDQLKLAIGIKNINRKVEEVDEKKPAKKSIDKYYDLAYNHRRDLTARRKAEEALKERLKSEKADYFPRVGVKGTYDYRDERDAGSEEEDEFWQVMLQASYPLFTGWRQSAQIDQARSRFDQSAARREELHKRVRIDVRSAFLQMKTEERVIKTARKQVSSARENYEEIVARFEEGLTTSLDVSDAHDALSEAEQSLAASHYQQQLNILKLKLAAGIYQQGLLN